ncbi:MAG: hypothetical protein ACTSPB_23910, partial [Candidatus Thorarchaeota archaeon]
MAVSNEIIFGIITLVVVLSVVGFLLLTWSGPGMEPVKAFLKGGWNMAFGWFSKTFLSVLSKFVVKLLGPIFLGGPFKTGTSDVEETITTSILESTTSVTTTTLTTSSISTEPWTILVFVVNCNSDEQNLWQDQRVNFIAKYPFTQAGFKIKYNYFFLTDNEYDQINNNEIYRGPEMLPRRRAMTSLKYFHEVYPDYNEPFDNWFSFFCKDSEYEVEENNWA